MCFSNFCGHEVKDANARKSIEVLNKFNTGVGSLLNFLVGGTDIRMQEYGVQPLEADWNEGDEISFTLVDGDYVIVASGGCGYESTDDVYYISKRWSDLGDTKVNIVPISIGNSCGGTVDSAIELSYDPDKDEFKALCHTCCDVGYGYIYEIRHYSRIKEYEFVANGETHHIIDNNYNNGGMYLVTTTIPSEKHCHVTLVCTDSTNEINNRIDLVTASDDYSTNVFYDADYEMIAISPLVASNNLAEVYVSVLELFRPK